MADDGFTWTKHRETGGYFRCPNDALAEMAKRGWEPSEPPREPNPAIDERLAWLADQEASATKAENDKSTKPRRGESE